MSTITTDPTPPNMTASSTTTTTTSPTTSSSSSQPKPSSISPSLTSPSTTHTTDRHIAEARAALEASMHNIGSNLDATLKSRATNLHTNNAVLNTQIKELEKETLKLKKETDRLKRVADDAQRKIKETGNVQNWAEVVEREFLILEETVRLVEDSEGGESDYGPCRVCGVYVEVEDKNEGEGEGLLWCRGCEGEFHPHCVGLECVPAGEWFCAECEHQGTYLMDVKGKGKERQDEMEVVPGDGLGVGAVDGKNVNDGDVEMGGMNGHEEGNGKQKEKEKEKEAETAMEIEMPVLTKPVGTVPLDIASVPTAPDESTPMDAFMETSSHTIASAGEDPQINHSPIPLPS